MTVTAGRIDRPRSAGPFALRRIDYPGGTRQRRHHHPLSSITVVLTGAIRESTSAGEVVGSAFSVVVKAAGVEHADEVGPEGARTLQIAFDAETPVVDDAGLHDWRWIHGGAPTRPMVRLSRLLNRPAGPGPELLEEGVLEVIAALDEAEPARGDPPGWLATVREALNDELEDGVTVQELARRVGVHPVSVSRAFRRHYGWTVSEYRRRERIRRAARRIAGSRESLSRIAHATGHTDHSHFCREFRRVAGLTPSEFRRLIG